MYKKISILLVLLMFLFSAALPAYAGNNQHVDAHFQKTAVQQPVIYERDIVVTEAGGVYQVGFTTIKIPENFTSGLPVTLHVEVASVNGEAGIEFTPDIPCFNADVTIIVHSYNGLLYDKTLGKNLKQNIHQQILKVQHFSRYAFS
ncbi:MAG TPA: hypothetical protein VHT34_11220 [Clostridia bacterium]|nr:hypothetical protein [Clostridia bacterium]